MHTVISIIGFLILLPIGIIIGIIFGAIFLSPLYLLILLFEKIFKENRKRKIRDTCVILIYFMILPWMLDLFSCINYSPSVSYKIANYDYTSRMLSFIDNVSLENSQVAYLVRKSLFNQYANIKNNVDNRNYESIAIFSDINEDYIKIKNKYVNNVNKEYTELYLSELKNNIDTYVARNKSLDIPRDGDERYERKAIIPTRFCWYSVHNRIILYPRLALSYLYQADIPKSKETIKDLTMILENFNIIYSQEKAKNSKDYQHYQDDYYMITHNNAYKDFSKFTYSMFLNKYSETIIKMIKDLDKDNVCKNTNIFNYYLQSIKAGCDGNAEIINIISKECKYKSKKYKELSEMHQANSKEPYFNTYMVNLQKRIKSNWNPPSSKNSNSVVLLFKIDKNGNVSNTKILESSNDTKVDNSALEALKKSEPLEPLPKEFKGNSVDIQFTFDYNVLR